MYFRVTVTDDANRYPTWALYGDNHKMVAWEGEGCDSHANATGAANALKSDAATHYETVQDVGETCWWRAWRSSDNVAASGESFAGQYNAERTVENVRATAPYASGP
jgi:uncharacterized protein